MSIREAIIEDAAYIKALIAELGYGITEKEVENNIQIQKQYNRHVFVAESKDRIVGFISGSYIPLFHTLDNYLELLLCVWMILIGLKVSEDYWYKPQKIVVVKMVAFILK